MEHPVKFEFLINNEDFFFFSKSNIWGITTLKILLFIGNLNLTGQLVSLFVKSGSPVLRDLKRTHIIRSFHLH